MCKIQLRRKDISALDDKNRENIPLTKLIIKSNFYYRPKLKEKSSIINKMQQWEVLWSWIPSSYLIRDLRLVFTTKRDGYNLHTLYNKCRNCGPNILLMECVAIIDTQKQVQPKTTTIQIENILDHPLALDPLALDALERMATREQQKGINAEPTDKMVKFH